MILPHIKLVCKAPNPPLRYDHLRVISGRRASRPPSPLAVASNSTQAQSKDDRPLSSKRQHKGSRALRHERRSVASVKESKVDSIPLAIASSTSPRSATSPQPSSSYPLIHQEPYPLPMPLPDPSSSSSRILPHLLSPGFSPGSNGRFHIESLQQSPNHRSVIPGSVGHYDRPVQYGIELPPRLLMSSPPALSPPPSVVSSQTRINTVGYAYAAPNGMYRTVVSPSLSPMGMVMPSPPGMASPAGSWYRGYEESLLGSLASGGSHSSVK
jgi:hypothetical protein